VFRCQLGNYLILLSCVLYGLFALVSSPEVL